MNLKKNTVHTRPMPKEKPLLVLVKNDDDKESHPNLIWTTGYYGAEGWLLDRDDLYNYTVLEYYVLPERYSVSLDFSQKQAELEAFWYDK